MYTSDYAKQLIWYMMPLAIMLFLLPSPGKVEVATVGDHKLFLADLEV